MKLFDGEAALCLGILRMKLRELSVCLNVLSLAVNAGSSRLTVETKQSRSLSLPPLLPSLVI